jgi:hypothetical protein
VTSLLALVLLSLEPSAAEGDGAPVREEKREYGPFFEDDPPGDTSFPSVARKTKAPFFSVGGGAFCFVEDSHCKASLLVSAEVAAGMREPASDKGPDMPYAHFGFRGGLVVRPLMFSRRAWHPWGVGLVGSWTRGTGAVTVEGDFQSTEVDETSRTDAWRIAMVNQIWLSQKPHAFHIDGAIGVVRSPVLTSDTWLYGSHAEIAFGFGGWGSVYAGGDFLDRDARVVFGVRAHGIAAGPIVAMALAGLAIGGAL